MARPRLGLLILLLVAPVAAVVTQDPAGDGELQRAGAPRDPAATDIVAVEGTLDDGTLRLRLEVAGELPIDGDEDADRRYTYLLLVEQGGGDAPLDAQAATAITCMFHRGMNDLQCEVTQGDATSRGIGHDGRNVTSRLSVAWSGDFRVGGAAHESLPNGTQRDILVQDFTDNALPNQAPPTDDEAPPGPTGESGWWKSPWIILVVLVVLVLAGWAWSQRPGGEQRAKQRVDERHARHRGKK